MALDLARLNALYRQCGDPHWLYFSRVDAWNGSLNS